ncbi:MAG TPA: exodeoxyribonuclease VII small subunit [Bdellovibrionota bacterium]|nr:exodeoxyribonuclease VII small subunit [Bdellovibrionota bacterium]
MIDDDIKKLDDIAKKMESGSLNLEEALDSFKQGIELVKECQNKLQKAELRVKEILEKDGAFSEGDVN